MDIEKYHLLTPEQSGFRPGRSTLDDIVDLENYIHEVFKNKQKVFRNIF